MQVERPRAVVDGVDDQGADRLGARDLAEPACPCRVVDRLGHGHRQAWVFEPAWPPAAMIREEPADSQTVCEMGVVRPLVERSVTEMR